MIYEFKVTGTGSFPIDMLRYDSCYPSGSPCVTLIEGSIREYSGLYSKPYTVTLRSAHKPTIGRWESFSYKVSDIQKVR